MYAHAQMKLLLVRTGCVSGVVNLLIVLSFKFLLCLSMHAKRRSIAWKFFEQRKDWKKIKQAECTFCPDTA